MKKTTILIIITIMLFMLSGIKNNNKTELNRINHDMVQACTIDMAIDKNIICD